MVYADYQFYTDQYHGTMPEADFTRLAIRASAYLDYITSDRAGSYNDRDNKLKMACCAVADDYYSIEAGKMQSSYSFSTDGYSETRNFHVENKTFARILYDTVRIYLLNTGLLYRGIERRC